MKRKMQNVILLLGVSLAAAIGFCGCGNEAKSEETGIETVEINKKWKEMVRPAARRSRLEREAVSVVNQIIRENPRKLSGNCTRVKLTEQLSDKKWKGAAYLDNDRKLTCYVTESFAGLEVEVEYEEKVEYMEKYEEKVEYEEKMEYEVKVAVPVWTW